MKQYNLGLYEKAMPNELTWRQKFEAAKEAGYDFIEISIDETDEKLSRLDMSREERRELNDLVNEFDIPFGSMCLSGHRKYPLGSNDPEIEKRSLEIMEKSIKLADDLGIRIIMLAGYDVYYEESSEETKKRFEKNLLKSTLLAAEAGVMLGFETMETPFMNTVEKAMHYVNQVDLPFLNVYPDAGNITNAAVEYGTDVLKDLETGKGHLVGLHLKETVPGKFREIPYGTGHVDFTSMINKAWDLGIRRYVTEFWYTGNPEWQKELNDTRKLMGDLLDEAEQNQL